MPLRASGGDLWFVGKEGARHLPIREVRVPHVEDEDDARVGAAVPRLVLEGVVEDHALALAVLHVLLRHAQLRARGAWRLKAENPRLWGGLWRAPEAMASFQDARAALWGA